MIKNIFAAFAVTLIALLTSCSIGPEPIRFGKDQCDYCKMNIADSKFGAELVTDKGRVYKFDAVECMVPFMKENPGEYAHVLAVPFDEPKSLHPVSTGHFVISDSIRSPMGANLLVFKNKSTAQEYAQSGKLYDWSGIEQYLLNEDW